VRLQIIDTAERLEAAAKSLGEIGLAIPLSADSLGQDGAEFGFHRTPVAGGAHAQLLLHRWLDIADGQRAHTGYFVRQYAYIIGIVDEECNACDAVKFREELRAGNQAGSLLSSYLPDISSSASAFETCSSAGSSGSMNLRHLA
jgi:hypothetical protein